MTRLLTLVVVCLGLVGLGATTAHAENNPPDKCFVMKDGVLPTCEYDGEEWTVSYEDGVGVFDDGSGMGVEPGIPPGFVALGILVVLLSLAGVAYRVSLARRMATDSGMDPDRATAMTLLSDDGLDATYLAASLRGDRPSPPVADAPTDPSAPTAGDRLRELQQLREEGLLTYEEYEARRKAIVDSL